MQPLDGRLARCQRHAPQERLSHKTGSSQARPQDAARSHRKKRPRLGTVAQICEAWTEAHDSHHHSRTPAKQLGKIAGPINPHELTALHIHSLVASWKSRYARNTVHGYVQELRKILAHIGALAGRPDTEKLAPRVAAPRPRTTIADPIELQKLLAAAPGWMRCAILLAVHEGLRTSDLLRIAPIHYNAEARTLTFEQKKTERPVTLPITAQLAECLEQAPATDNPATPFIELYRGGPTAYTRLRYHWSKLKRITHADPNLHMHDLRHTLAVGLYEISKDLRVVEQMLGHQSLQSTIRYLEHQDTAKLKPYLDALWTPKGPVN